MRIALGPPSPLHPSQTRHPPSHSPPSPFRLPGLGIVYAQATTGVPVSLAHLMANCPALPRVMVILTLRCVTSRGRTAHTGAVTLLCATAGLLSAR